MIYDHVLKQKPGSWRGNSILPGGVGGWWLSGFMKLGMHVLGFVIEDGVLWTPGFNMAKPRVEKPLTHFSGIRIGPWRSLDQCTQYATPNGSWMVDEPLHMVKFAASYWVCHINDPLDEPQTPDLSDLPRSSNPNLFGRLMKYMKSFSSGHSTYFGTLPSWAPIVAPRIWFLWGVSRLASAVYPH